MLGNLATQALSGLLSGGDIDPTLKDPDYPVIPPALRDRPDQPLLPAETTFEPVIDKSDPAAFFIPQGTSRAEIASRLYGDPNHIGGFDIIREDYVRLRNFEGVAAEVATPMRAEFEARLPKDVGTIVSILEQRLILGGDEWRLLETTVWWSNHSDFTDARNRSYFDRYLDALASQKLTEERPIISDITHTALEWLLDEAEEKAWAIYPLIAKRSTRGPMRAEDTRLPGPLNKGDAVGSYSYRTKRPALAFGEWDYLIGEIQVVDRIVDESSAARAEIALRNSPHRGPRVMIPGGDGRFYGYTINFPRLEEGYTDPSEHWYQNQPPQHIDNWWWQYPGMVVIPGGEFQPEFAPGGEPERAQRQEILTRAMAGGAEDQLGLDFDTLSLATLDQRMMLIDAAIKRHENADASLITRVLYSTPAADFPLLERRMSTGDTIQRLVNMPDPGGRIAMIGRIFTVKSLESMQVAGENLEHLPELTAGFDEEGYVHCADFAGSAVPSKIVAESEFGRGGQVALGHERALPGETPGSITRAVITIRPRIIRIGSLVGMLWRKTWGSFLDAAGPDVGPLLPTQLVRVTILGTPPQTRIVTALEAVGLLTPPSGEVIQRAISATTRGYMWIMAGTGLAQAFGPAFAEGLLASGEARGIAGALLTRAGTEAGTSALLSAAALSGMAAIDSNRDEFSKTEAGRAFLELYDAAMLIWAAHDVGRLIVSGLIPRLAKSIDAIISMPGALRDAVLPLRDEIEAMRRAIARYRTPEEAAEAAVAGGMTMQAGADAERPGFFNVLRASRGEVASERLLERLAGSASESSARKVLNRLDSLVQRSEKVAASSAAGPEAREAAAETSKSAATARLSIARRAAQLRPDARDALLQAAERIVDARPNSLGSVTDFLAAAAESRQPNLYLAEVQKLVNRKGVSNEALAVLGKKAYGEVLEMSDLVWLNRTSLTDETLDFLARDERTAWSVFRRAVTDPTGTNVMRNFRTSARGAAAEMVAAPEAEELGTNVRRQVPMGSSEIDFEFSIGRRRYGFEVKGWTPDTWEEALDAAIARLNRRPPLTEEQREAVKKIDNMLKQLRDAKDATGSRPYLGLTDKLDKAHLRQLERILESKQLGDTKIIPLSEDAIKETAAVKIGEALGVPRQGT
jgi:hypothetical protein